MIEKTSIRAQMSTNYTDDQIEEITRLSEELDASKSKIIRAALRIGLNHFKTLKRAERAELIKE